MYSTIDRCKIQRGLRGEVLATFLEQVGSYKRRWLAHCQLTLAATFFLVDVQFNRGTIFFKGFLHARLFWWTQYERLLRAGAFQGTRRVHLLSTLFSLHTITTIRMR